MPTSRDPDPRPMRKGDRQREAIIQALVRLLGHKGISELSVADIAGEAGVTRSGYYFYFESKYAALSSASAGLWVALGDATSSYVRPDGEPVAAYVRRILGEGLRIWQENSVAARGRALSVTALSPAMGWEHPGRHVRLLALKLFVAGQLTARAAPLLPLLMRSATLRRAGLKIAVAHGDRMSVAAADVGHVPMYDDPELVVRTILDLTSRIDNLRR